MTPLHQKLNQLSLTSMVRQLDQTIADAAAKKPQLRRKHWNRSWICELESRNSRSIERRFRLSRLHAQHSIDSFHFKHHKSRMELKPRILRLLDLEFIAQGHQRDLYRQSRRGQNIPGENHRLARLPGQSARPVHHRHGHAQPPARFAGRSLADPQAQALHRAGAPHLSTS